MRGKFGPELQLFKFYPLRSYLCIMMLVPSPYY